MENAKGNAHDINKENRKVNLLNGINNDVINKMRVLQMYKNVEIYIMLMEIIAIVLEISDEDVMYNGNLVPFYSILEILLKQLVN